MGKARKPSLMCVEGGCEICRNYARRVRKLNGAANGGALWLDMRAEPWFS